MPQLRQLKAKDMVMKNGNELVHWAPLSNGILCVAVNGHLFELQDSSKSRIFMQKLNTGEHCSLQKFFRGDSKDFKSLQKIYQARGFVLPN